MNEADVMLLLYIVPPTISLPYLSKCKTTVISDDPPKKYVCQGKMYLSKSKMTPKK